MSISVIFTIIVIVVVASNLIYLLYWLLFLKDKKKKKFIQNLPILVERLGIKIGHSSELGIHGTYRKHRLDVEIVQDEIKRKWYHNNQTGNMPDYTQIAVRIEENPRQISMMIRPKVSSDKMRNVFGKRDTEVSNSIFGKQSTFDKKFVVQGSNESDIQKVLTQSIQDKIVSIRGFNMKIIGEYIHYWEAEYIIDTDRLESFIEVFIDIAEQVESLK